MTQATEYTLPAIDLWQVIEHFRVDLRKAFASDFKGLILYGSYARGEENEGSDIDVIVLFKDGDVAAASDTRVGELTHHLLEEYQALVSAISMGERKYQLGCSPYFLNVKREGILILAEEAKELSEEIDALMQQSRTSLTAAPRLFEDGEGFYGFAASRAYYAMFYAVEAVLLSKGLSFSSHRAVISAFGQHFAREGILPTELHSMVGNAFKLRTLGDYSTDPFTEEMAVPVLENAQRVVTEVQDYLDQLLGR